MAQLAHRDWVPEGCETRVQVLADSVKGQGTRARIAALAARNRAIHEAECFNLNPAANVMHPAAEAMLDAGLYSRPSLGYPGDKY